NASPPYPAALQTTLRGAFGIDLLPSAGQASLTTTPILGQGNFSNPSPEGTIPASPPVIGPVGIDPTCSTVTGQQWYCHQNPAGNYCIPNSLSQPGDTGVTGPYASQAMCQGSCAGSSSIPFWCHVNPTGNYCSQTNSLQAGDTNIT